MQANTFSFKHPGKEPLEHLLSIRGDLVRASNALTSLIDQAEMFGGGGLLAEAVFTLAIVAYVRCFASGRRKGLSQELFNGEPQLLAAHKEIKSIRDQHIAHAVGVLENLLVLVAADDQDSEARGVGSLGVFFSHTQKRSTLRLFLRVVKHALKHADREIERIGSKLASELMQKPISWRKSQQAFRRAIGMQGYINGSVALQKRMDKRSPKILK